MEPSPQERALENRFLARLAIWSRESPWPGILICVLLTLIAAFLNKLAVPPFTLADGRHPISMVSIALLLGILLRNLVSISDRLRPGLDFVVKFMLPIGIVLLGARIDFSDLALIGGFALLASVVSIVTAILITYLLARGLMIPPKLGLLIGVGTAICGTAAIVATAPVVKAKDEEIASSIATVNVLGVLAMLLFPILGSIFQTDPGVFGAWCGLSIHATPQVLAAGFSHLVDSQQAGEVATIVKLARISLLCPAVMIIGAVYAHQRRKEAVDQRQPIKYFQLIPMFLVLFMLMTLVRTLGLLPDITMHLSEQFVFGREAFDFNFSLAEALGQVADWIMIAAMAAVGLGIDLRSLQECGTRSFRVGLLSAIGIALMGLVLAQLMFLAM